MLRLLERAREQQVGVPGAAQHRLHQHDPARARAVVPRRRGRSSAGSAPSSAGTPRSWCPAPTARASRSAATSRRTQSAASLYEVGFNHFFRGKDHPGGGDQIYIQGHASPGIYARAFLEGRLTEEQLDGFRQEVSARPGDGPAVVPAPAADAGLLGVPDRLDGPRPRSTRSTRRGSTATCTTAASRTPAQQHVWAFLGDGEMDEPESLGAIGLAAREELDNLTFVINCNLQQLDGPVRGNGKIIQELESYFRGAGWNVIKVVWGREWDALLARDVDGVLVNQMNTHARRPVPDLLGRDRRLHPRALLRRRPAAAQDGRAHDRRADRASCRAAATTTARCTPRSRPRPSTSASRR